jgi:hypothetical protein
VVKLHDHSPGERNPAVTAPHALRFSLTDNYKTVEQYGDSYWLIGLTDGREAGVLADSVRVRDDGTLEVRGSFKAKEQESHPMLYLAPGTWTSAYAASLLSEAPCVISSLQQPDTESQPASD